MATLNKQAQHRAGSDSERPSSGAGIVSEQCQTRLQTLQRGILLVALPCCDCSAWMAEPCPPKPGPPSWQSASSEIFVCCRYCPKFPWSGDLDTILLKSSFRSGRVVIQNLVFSILPESISQDDLGKMSMHTQTVLHKSRLVSGRTWESSFRTGLSAPLEWRHRFR